MEVQPAETHWGKGAAWPASLLKLWTDSGQCLLVLRRPNMSQD